jgi:O-antigen/teichoic acid export membrane protein
MLGASPLRRPGNPGTREEQDGDGLLSLLFDSGVTFGLRLGAAAAAYVLNVVLVRVLGATETGNYVYALSWFWLLSVVPTLGLGATTQRFVPQSLARGELAYAKGYVLVARRLSVGMAFAVAAAASAAVLTFDVVAEVAIPALIAFCALPIHATMVVNASLAQAEHRYLVACILEVFLRPTLVLTAVVAAVGLGFRLSAINVVLLQVAGITLSATLEHLAIARPFARKYDHVRARYQVLKWLRVAIPSLVIVLPIGYWVEINIVVAGASLTAEQLTLHNAVLRTVAVVGFGLSAVNGIVSPRLARAYAEGDTVTLTGLTRRGAALMFWPAMLALPALALWGDVVLALFDESFVAGHRAMLIAYCGLLLMAAAGPAVPLLMMTAHQDLCLLVMVVIFAATIALNTMLVPLHGLEGAALAVFITGCIWLLALQIAVRRTFGFWADPFSPVLDRLISTRRASP